MKLEIRGEELEIKNCGEGDCENGAMIRRLVEAIAGVIVDIEHLAETAPTPQLKDMMFLWRDKIFDALEGK